MSSPKEEAGSPLSVRARPITSCRSGRLNCLPERFTDSARGEVRGNSLCHSTARRQASSSTNSPMGTTKPLSSATGTNSSGPAVLVPGAPTSRAPPPPHRAGLTANYRLVMDDELVPFYGTPKIVLKLQAIHRPPVHGLIEHLVVRALGLGPVHGGVCLP